MVPFWLPGDAEPKKSAKPPVVLGRFAGPTQGTKVKISFGLSQYLQVVLDPSKKMTSFRGSYSWWTPTLICGVLKSQPFGEFSGSSRSKSFLTRHRPILMGSQIRGDASLPPLRSALLPPKVEKKFPKRRPAPSPLQRSMFWWF